MSGNLIISTLRVVVACLSFWAYPAYSEVSPGWTSDIRHLPETIEEYTPPDWLTCPSALPDEQEKHTCLEVSDEGERPVYVVRYHEAELRLLQQINERVNSSLTGTGLHDMIWAAKEKKRRLIEENVPVSALSYAVVEAPTEEGGGDDIVFAQNHVVLVVRFDQIEMVLDGVMLDVMSWSCTPYRFSGIQSLGRVGKWHAVADDRHDPIESSNECLCVTADCAMQ